ncbi:hypothetical protein J4471_05550 [Candidatus Woesearchaeota archaeon]|nr:hypothetical protein [Candidatus Woesearchaeota archaeon]
MLGKKEKWFKITIVWLLLMDALIVQKLVSDYYTSKSLQTNDLITGSVVAIDINTMSILNEAFFPLLIYNVIIALLLTLNYKRERK